jgi:hypothetical protein
MSRTTSTRGSRTTKVSTSQEHSLNEETGEVEAEGNVDIELGRKDTTPPRRSPTGGIDLGKGLDVEKPRPPRSPIGIEIGKSPSGNLGVGVEVPIGLSPFGARGGVSIDPATGKIRGGYGGLGVGKGPIKGSVDVGVDTPPGSEEFGCFKYVTVTLGPFSHTYGKDECTPKSSPTPPGFTPPSAAGSPVSDATKSCKGGVYVLGSATVFHGSATGSSRIGSWTVRFKEAIDNDLANWTRLSSYNKEGDEAHANNYHGAGKWQMITLGRQEKYRKGGWNWQNETYRGGDLPQAGNTGIDYQGAVSLTRSWKYDYYYPYPWAGDPFTSSRWFTGSAYDYKVVVTSISPPPPCPNGEAPQKSSPPLPNPPPKKKMDNDCCKIVMLLQLETLRMLGRQVVGGKLIPISTAKGFLGEEIERVETPIEDITKPKKIKIKFNNIYELLAYSLQQANNLDTALDPQSYKPPTGYLQNPEYNRDTEESLINNTQPKADKSGNKREFKINEDEEVRFSGFIQQQCYIFEAIKRLEYLFPIGELNDAKIAKDLLIPGAEADLKIHNMIMAYEVQMQYLNASLGNAREILTIKDANPAIEGDQPIEVKCLSISDLLRQNLKFQIETGGDLDALVNLVIRDFRTNLANRIDQVKTAEMVQALFEDSGMRENQDYIPLHLEGDPYAGQWVKGQGFQANPDLEKKTEEATEKVLQETMKPTDIKIKVLRRHKDEKTDMRDLLRGLADFIQRLLSIPSAGDAAKSIDKLVESAKFKVQTEMALIRQNVAQAATASRNRTKKRKK